MKKTHNPIWPLLLFAALFSIALSGCVETEYYHRYHHHSREWYDHHREPYPPDVNFDIDVH